ncbi:hypothetical protein F0562_018490 [Nyssa sinensis]|uniref:BTB domain-containing protein n=1 Tax=Nyssa sinensis TaxID=561372 RepID=A0A5J4ZA24_9ASTE|nr:hypothetical protein F0562_018490 [Nyssa sinensis]
MEATAGVSAVRGVSLPAPSSQPSQKEWRAISEHSVRNAGNEIPESMNLQLGKSSSSQEAFELCAKFCYGITITLCAFNIVSTRCAAEYLQMTEDVEKGNLIYKIEVFFNSCILHG